MTTVREFYANANKATETVTMVREKQIRFDVVTINWHFSIQAPQIDDVTNIDRTADLDEVIKVIYGKVVNWIVVRGTCISFLTKELVTDIKIWHHFICARLVPTSHLTEVSRERVLLLYAIVKNLSINVG